DPLESVLLPELVRERRAHREARDVALRDRMKPLQGEVVLRRDDEIVVAGFDVLHEGPARLAAGLHEVGRLGYDLDLPARTARRGDHPSVRRSRDFESPLTVRHVRISAAQVRWYTCPQRHFRESLGSAISLAQWAH